VVLGGVHDIIFNLASKPMMVQALIERLLLCSLPLADSSLENKSDAWTSPHSHQLKKI
jgi:hypothetical protein